MPQDIPTMASDQKQEPAIAAASPHSLPCESEDSDWSMGHTEMAQKYPPGCIFRHCKAASRQESPDSAQERSDKALVLRVDEGWNAGVVKTEHGYELEVNDGWKTFCAMSSELEYPWPDHTLASRLLSHGAATPSPRCLPDPRRWEWLTPEGLATAAHRAVTVPRASIPHLIGRGGRGIRQAEESLGLLIGLMDRAQGDATVTLIGPEEKLEMGAAVVTALGQGVRSVLGRLLGNG